MTIEIHDSFFAEKPWASATLSCKFSLLLCTLDVFGLCSTLVIFVYNINNSLTQIQKMNTHEIIFTVFNTMCYTTVNNIQGGPKKTGLFSDLITL